MLANSLQVLSPERARCFNVGSSSPGPLWHNPDSEDDFFGVITFTLKPGGLLFGVQLPPRLPKGASEAERRARFESPVGRGEGHAWPQKVRLL